MLHLVVIKAVNQDRIVTSILSKDKNINNNNNIPLHVLITGLNEVEVYAHGPAAGRASQGCADYDTGV